MKSPPKITLMIRLLVNHVKLYKENTTQGPIENKINIISDVLIKLCDKIVLGNGNYGKCDLIP